MTVDFGSTIMNTRVLKRPYMDTMEKFERQRSKRKAAI